MVEVVEMKVEDISHLFSSFHFLFLSFFDFSPLFIFKFQKNDIRIWRSYRIYQESM